MIGGTVIGSVRRYLAATFSSLSSRDYRRFVGGQLVSVSGTWMQKLAQAWLVLVLTDSGLMLGITVALQQLPTLLFSTTGGAIADRFDKRRILLCTTLGGALPALAIGIVVQVDVVEIWMVMAAALVQGLVDAIDKPARLTLVNDIADPKDLTNAVALNSIVQDSGKLVGPALAGVLIATVGISTAFFVNAASYVPVFVALLLIRARPRRGAARSMRRRGNLSESIRYVATQPELAAALALTAVVGLLAYNWSVLLPLLARDTFGANAGAVGFAFTALGLGGLVGGLALAGYLRATAGWQIAAGSLLAVGILGLAAAPSLAAAYVILFFVGAASVAFKASATSLIQLRADPRMRGRVVALYVMATAGTTPLGGPVQGWLAEELGARAALTVAGVGSLLASGVAYRLLRARRRRSRPATPPEGVVADDQTDLTDDNSPEVGPLPVQAPDANSADRSAP